MNQKRVLVGMSGGVDSSVSVWLLKEQGYEVEGATMIMFGDEEANKNLITDAKKAAERQNIKHNVLDVRDVFYDKVIKNFISEYDLGRTPNPCVSCNKNIKFGLFLDYAKRNNFDYIATGHYAKIIYDENSDEYLLKKSDFENKDQSYVLYNLTQDILKHVLFPIGNYDKAEVKKIAKENNLISENKKESQDICFIPDGDYVKFLEKITNQKSPKGNFIDENGKIYGPHKGIWNYTVGQRKSLGLSFNKRMFVSKIDPDEKTVTISEIDPHSNILFATDINVVSPKRFKDGMSVEAKIRYKHKQKTAKIEIQENNDIKVIFEEPQRAITKGQSVVFYKDDIVIAGGVIR